MNYEKFTEENIKFAHYVIQLHIRNMRLQTNDIIKQCDAHNICYKFIYQDKSDFIAELADIKCKTKNDDIIKLCNELITMKNNAEV